MTTKELVRFIEDRVDRLAITVGFAKDNAQLPEFREQLLMAVTAILEAKLTEPVAYKIAEKVLDRARKELRQRRKAAASNSQSAEFPGETPSGPSAAGE